MQQTNSVTYSHSFKQIQYNKTQMEQVCKGLKNTKLLSNWQEPGVEITKYFNLSLQSISHK